MDKQQLFDEINVFDDAEFIKKHGSTRKYARVNFEDMDRDDLENVIFGYWSLMHKLLND